jgi:hypothetical protein
MVGLNGGGLEEAAVDQVHSVPTSGQEEEVSVLKEINHLQESQRVVHKSKRMVASQQVLELHGLFEESLRSLPANEEFSNFMGSLRNPFVPFFFERWKKSSFQEAHLELTIM